MVHSPLKCALVFLLLFAEVSHASYLIPGTICSHPYASMVISGDAAACVHECTNSSTCLNGGTCTPDGSGGGTCTCIGSYTGNFCEAIQFAQSYSHSTGCEYGYIGNIQGAFNFGCLGCSPDGSISTAGIPGSMCDTCYQFYGPSCGQVLQDAAVWETVIVRLVGGFSPSTPGEASLCNLTTLYSNYFVCTYGAVTSVSLGAAMAQASSFFEVDTIYGITYDDPPNFPGDVVSNLTPLMQFPVLTVPGIVLDWSPDMSFSTDLIQFAFVLVNGTLDWGNFFQTNWDNAYMPYLEEFAVIGLAPGSVTGGIYLYDFYTNLTDIIISSDIDHVLLPTTNAVTNIFVSQQSFSYDNYSTYLLDFDVSQPMENLVTVIINLPLLITPENSTFMPGPVNLSTPDCDHPYPHPGGPPSSKGCNNPFPSLIYWLLAGMPFQSSLPCEIFRNSPVSVAFKSCGIIDTPSFGGSVYKAIDATLITFGGFLDLSYNQIAGVMPNITDSLSLGADPPYPVVNLAFNQLTGEIPSGVFIAAFNGQTIQSQMIGGENNFGCLTTLVNGSVVLISDIANSVVDINGFDYRATCNCSDKFVALLLSFFFKKKYNN